MAVDAILKIIDPLTAVNVDLKDIKLVKKLGGTIDDTEMIEGIVFDKCKPSAASGGPTKI
jgi:T-complex protein 1 subunit delta